MTVAEYAEVRAALSMRFAALVNVNNAIPAEQVSDEDLPLYKETVAALKKPRAKAAPTKLSLRVISKGQTLGSGAAMNSGDGMRLEVDVPQLSYLYVVLIDSQGSTSRLYPAALTGTENPVKGTVSIPSDPGAELSLDNNPGKERILAFAQEEQSVAIETTLKEVDLEGRAQGPSSTNAVLTRGIGVRKKLQDSAASGASETMSDFGMAALEFVIDHR
jgi:hypothetical protein